MSALVRSGTSAVEVMCRKGFPLLPFRIHHVMMLQLHNHLWIVYTRTPLYVYRYTEFLCISSKNRLTWFHLICHFSPPERPNHWAPLTPCRLTIQLVGDEYTSHLLCQTWLTANGCVMPGIAAFWRLLRLYLGLTQKQFCYGCGKKEVKLICPVFFNLWYFNTWGQKMFPDSKSPVPQSFGHFGP